MIGPRIRRLLLTVMATGLATMALPSLPAQAACLDIFCEDELPVSNDPVVQAQLDLEPPPTSVSVGTGVASPAAATVIPTSTASSATSSPESFTTTSTLPPFPSDYKTRTQVTALAYPETATVHVNIWYGSNSGSCTGSLIGPRTVGLAGHCVYERDHGWGWATSILLIPGHYGGTTNAYSSGKQPYGTCTGSHWFTVKGWKERGKDAYDYGAVNIGSCSIGDRNVGNRAGWYGFRTTSNRSINGLATNMSGYPQGVPLNKTLDQMWKGSGGAIYRVTDHTFLVKIQAAQGDSGAGIWRGDNDCNPCLYGAQLALLISSTATENQARRITDGMFNNWKNWRTK